MAEENIVTTIVARSDFSDLISDLSKVSSRLLTLQQQLSTTNKTLAMQAAQMQKAFADTMRSTGQFSTHFVSLSSDVDKFGRGLDSGRLKLGQYYRTWQEHARTSGGLIRQLATQQVQLQNAVLQPLGRNAQGLMQFNVHIPQGLDRVKNSTALAKQELLIMNKVIQDGANQVINWGKNTQWAGRQLTVGLTLPIAAFGKAAADAFRQADQELVRLTKVYGGVAATSAADLAKIRREVSETAKQMSSEYGASYKETIALAADIAATGKEGNDLLVATQETTRLSILGEVDRQEAMKATLAIQSAFKQNTTELSESINFLNAVENQTSTSLADLVEAIPKAGPVVKALGGDVQDLALYLTAMREGGINASEGANALKSALASIINPTKVAKEQFMGFGINLEGIVTKNAGNLTGTILEIQAALETLDPLKKSQAIEQLFGKFQFARMNALFENLGKQGSQTLQVLDLMKASSQDLANVAGRELSQITESASGKYKRALETLKADLATTGEKFLDVGTKIINIIDNVVKFFNKLPSPVKTILTFVTGLTALAGPIIMLTGLMANFFGYVAKGLFHFKALLKGGEGWKLLTPEILAAEKAGSLMEQTFYDDAKAAAILQKAISNLTAEISLLETKANSARVAVGPAVRTAAGNLVVEGAQRIVDPTHPLLGDPYTRASSHVNPVGDMTPEQRAAQTIFSFVPGTEPVNRKIGKNPQMYMSGDLPRIPGLTEFGGASSGIVSGEAAKWHAMTAAISMQSEQELVQLKAEVAATGAITSSLSDSYQALLPSMVEITSLAAQESAAIVAQLEAGKLTVDQARAKIIQLNANVEAMLVETTQSIAAGMGRTASLTTVPLTTQAVVDPITGKSNMREMFKKSAVAELADKIARTLGVRTSGGGYSIETTKPIRRNAGGAVYDPDKHGNVVPGDTSINYDNTPARLREGGFILNQDASKNNPELVRLAKNTYNSGGKIVDALLTPGETYFPPEMAQQIMPTLESANSGNRIRLRNAGGFLGGEVSMGRRNYGLLSSSRSQRTVKAHASRQEKMTAAEAVQRFGDVLPDSFLQFASNFPHAVVAGKDSKIFNLSAAENDALKNGEDGRRGIGLTKDELRKALSRVSILDDYKELDSLGRLEFHKSILDAVDKLPDSTLHWDDSLIKIFDTAESDVLSRLDGTSKKKFKESMISRANMKYIQHVTSMKDLSDGDRLGDGKPMGAKEARRLAGEITKPVFYTSTSGKVAVLLPGGKQGSYSRESGSTSKIKQALSLFKRPGVGRFNKGGQIGGEVSSSQYNYGVKALPDDVIERLTKKWPPVKQFYKPGFQYVLGNQDPLHGPLQIGRSSALRGFAGFDPKNVSLPRNVVYKDDRFSRLNIMPQFLHGDMDERARYALAQYMEGNLSIMSDIERLGMHPLGPAAAIKSLSTKFSGRLFRGVSLSRTKRALPDEIITLLRLAKETGDYTPLIGKEFIMRRSSWSKSSEIAEAFSRSKEDSLFIEALVKNRNIVPAGDIFPDLTYPPPGGGSWSPTGGPGYESKSEQEALFGGRFKIVEASPGKIKIVTVVDGQRENGGPVNANRPYLVGEKGPELFVPRTNGGIIPNYALGGKVTSRKKNYGEMPPVDADPAANAALLQLLGEQSEGQGRSPMGGYLKSMVGGQLAGIALSQIGGKLGGGTGQMIGYGLGQMAVDMLLMSQNAKSAAGNMTILSKATQFFMKMPGPVKLVAVILGVGMAIKKINDMIVEHRRVINSAFAPTETAVDKLGLKYKSLTDRVNDYKKAQDDAASQAAAYKYSTDKAPGTELSKKDYAALVESTKTDFATEIEMLNKASDEEAPQKVEQLKAMYVGMGEPVADVNNLIRAIIDNSDKAGMKLELVGTKGFGQIEDRASAAASTLKTFNTLVEEGGGDQLAPAFDSALNVLLNVEESLVGVDAKTKEVTTASEAYEKVLKQIKNINGENSTLSSDILVQLSQQNEVIASIVNDTDSFASLFAKIKLYTSGITFDLGNMSGAAAEALSVVVVKQEEILSATGGIYGSLASKAEQLSKVNANKITQNAEASAKAIRKEIDLHNKKIDKIKEEADARKNALDEQISDENVLIAIQKKQIEYQQALAMGDMSGAAQAQLDIQALSGQQEVVLAKRAIDDKAAKEIAKEQKAIDALNAKLDSLQSKVDAASAKAEAAQRQAADTKNLLDRLVQATQGATDGLLAPGEKDVVDKLIADLKKAGFGDLANKIGLVPGSKTTYGIEDIATNTFGDAYDKVKGSIKTTDADVLAAIKALRDGKELPFMSNTKDKPGIEVINDGTKQKNVSVAKNLGQASQLAAMGKVKTEQITDTKTGRDYNVFTYKGTRYASPIGFPYEVYAYGSEGVGAKIKNLQRTYNTGGEVQNFEPGGKVRGPGTGTSDSIPAMLSNGEYVIKASAVNQYGKEFFDMANQQKLAMGGAIPGYKNGGQPKTEKKSWFQKYVDGLINRDEEAKKILNKSPLTSWMSPDALGVTSLMKYFAGRGTGADKFAAAMLPLNFMGMGIPSRLGLLGHATVAGAAGAKAATAAKSVVKPIFSKITPSLGKVGAAKMAGKLDEQAALHAAGETVDPVYANKVILDEINAGMMESARQSGRRTPTQMGNAAEQFKDEHVDLRQASLLLGSDLGVSMRSLWGKAFDQLVKSGSPVVKGMTKDEFFVKLTKEAPGVMTRYSEEPASQFVKEANIALMKSLGFKSDQAVAMYRSTPYTSGKSAPGYYSMNERFATEYLRQYLHSSSIREFDELTGGLYQADIKPADFPSPIGYGGFLDEYSAVLGKEATAGAKRISSQKLEGAWKRGFPLDEYFGTKPIVMTDELDKLLTPKALEILPKYPLLSEYDIRKMLPPGETPGTRVFDFARLEKMWWDKQPLAFGSDPQFDKLDQFIMFLEEYGKSIGQDILVPKFAMGGMVGKYHKGGQVHKHKGASGIEQQLHSFRYDPHNPEDTFVPEIAGYGGTWMTPEQIAASNKANNAIILETLGWNPFKRISTGKTEPLGKSFLPDPVAEILGIASDAIGSVPLVGGTISTLLRAPKYIKMASAASKIGQLGKVATKTGAVKSGITITDDMIESAVQSQKQLGSGVFLSPTSGAHSPQAAEIVDRIVESISSSPNSMISQLSYLKTNPLPKIQVGPVQGGVKGFYEPGTRLMQVPSGKLNTENIFHEIFHDAQDLTSIAKIPFLDDLRTSSEFGTSIPGVADLLNNETAFAKIISGNLRLNNRYGGFQEGQAEVASNLMTQHFTENFDSIITPYLTDITKPNFSFSAMGSTGSGYLFPQKFKYSDLLQGKAVGAKYADPDFMEGIISGSKSILSPESFSSYSQRIALAKKFGIQFDEFGTLISGDLQGAIAEAIRLKMKNGGMVNIPKFENGINMVPTDMLAMLHKNEAVVPANMNPFNPNANTNGMPTNTVYTIAPVIHAAPGMDEQAIANMATRQVLAEIKTLNSNQMASLGRPGMRVVGK